MPALPESVRRADCSYHSNASCDEEEQAKDRLRSWTARYTVSVRDHGGNKLLLAYHSHPRRFYPATPKVVNNFVTPRFARAVFSAVVATATSQLRKYSHVYDFCSKITQRYSFENFFGATPLQCMRSNGQAFKQHARRVRYPSRAGRGAAVGRDLGVAAGLPVGVGLGVAVGVSVGEGTALGVGVGLPCLIVKA